MVLLGLFQIILRRQAIAENEQSVFVLILKTICDGFTRMLIIFLLPSILFAEPPKYLPQFCDVYICI